MTVRGRSGQTVIAYRALTPDELIDHLLDDGGLVRFVELQMRGVEPDDWDWPEITRRVWHLTRKHWQPLPATLRDIYVMQKDRAA